MAMNKGILLEENNDLKINVKRDTNGKIISGFTIGDTMIQEVGIILQMSQGELKSEPLIGANLVTMIRSVENKEKIQRHIAVQLDLDGKDYDEVKDLLKLNIR